MEARVSTFGDGDADRYDPYAGSPRDAYDRPPAYGGFDEHTPQHRRGSPMLVVALIGTLALIVVGAVAFAGSLLMARTSSPSPANAAAAASSDAGDPSGSANPLAGASGDPSGSATASAAPTTPGAPTTTKPASPKPKTTVGGNSSLELQVINLVNVERRKKANCPDVKNNDKLHAAAYKHSADMAKRDYFSHTTPEGVDFATRIKAENYSWSGAGENIAAGQDSAEAVMRDWMNSKGHRDNILNCSFVDLGVGLAYQIKNNRKYPYWTQDFGTPAKR
ncbi:hypothetical protein GCM10022255_043680 [Dactylosporangium darangshiense]|uniref:SCP domain-containing protein n=1 Tax=Dactylosporangium darangshiense TaxID=579108 RepID=A0ABP8DAK5_9ACTN